MRRMRKSALFVLLTIAVGLIASGCGDDSNDGTATPRASATAAPTATPTVAPLTSAQVQQPGPFGVGSTTMIFVDTSRPTMANGTYPGASSRTLVTEIWYPTNPDPSGSHDEQRDAPVASNGRPYPLIIYSHGFMSMRTGGAYIARHLAGYGYVVAAPDFPLSNGQAPGGPNVLDLVNQPGDVSFLIDRLLALNADPTSPLSGSIDAARIGLTGLSLGGSTTFLTAFHPTMRDPRVRAAAPMAGGACFFGPSFYGSTQLPLLIVQGDLDAIVPYKENGLFAFGEANVPKYLATIVGGSHTAFADGTQLLFETQNNPDDLGCRALGNVGGESDSTFLDLLGGPAAGIIIGDCPAPCAGPRPLPRSIRPTRQQQLTILSIFPFFEASLRDEARARHYLEVTLAAENPDITLQFER